MQATAAGAIPFLALSPPIAQMLPLLPAGLLANAALLQIGYGATIASFLGGIHWAMAMAEYGGASHHSLSGFLMCMQFGDSLTFSMPWCTCPIQEHQPPLHIAHVYASNTTLAATEHPVP